MTKPRPTWLPAATLRIQLQGLAALGLDAQRLRVAVGPVPEGADALVPQQAYLSMCREALAFCGDHAPPTALADAIPFRAFGALDYLVGSANTIAGAVESAHLHFAMVASDVWLDLHALDDRKRVVQVRGPPALPSLVLEFTLARMVSRLRHLGGRFELLRVRLPVARPPQDPVRERMYGALLVYGNPRAEIAISASSWLRASRPSCRRRSPMR